MSADLHCHTKLSDGSMGIEDIIILAEKQGVTTLSITDHDCMAGNIRAKVIGDRHGVSIIHGVEISATDSDTQEEVHILCYLSDSPDRLEGLCHRNLLARKKAAQYMMLKAAQRYPITPDLVLKCAQGSTNVYSVHIMAALVESGLDTEICGELYKKLFGKGARSVAVRPVFEDSVSVLEAIHDAGGIAVLAHPGKYSSYDVMEKLIDAGSAISGCGPAFVAMFIEAMADGGVREGLPRATAYELAAQTVLGTAELYMKTDMLPAGIKDMVTSPGGTTIEGVYQLEKGGMRAAVMDAVHEASEKNKKLA